MKFLIVFVALFALAVAAPSETEILKQESDVGAEGFSYAVETSDGAASEAKAVLENVGTDHEAIQVKGSYRFTGDDGVVYQVDYIANENGYQPSGAHLPVAP